MLRQLLTDRSGSASLVFVLGIPVFLGGLVLAVEIGLWQKNKTDLQHLADNAAIAAAREIKTLNEDADFLQTAEGDAFENGFAFSTGTLQAYSPPISGKYVGREGVQVVMTQQQPLHFSDYFLDRKLEFKATATALIVEGVPACVLSLSQTASPGIKGSGSSFVDITGCSAHSNSYSTGAFEMGGSAQFTADCASAIGTILNADQLTLTQCNSAQEYALPMDDPYADVEVPENVTAMACQKPKTVGKKGLQLSAGRYCKSVSNSNDIVLKDSGVYIFDGVDLVLNSGHASLTGTNVTLIFMNGGVIKNANGGLVNLTAQTDGPYAGLIFYTDRHTTPLGTNITFNGNQNSTMEGVLYFPTVDLKMNGASNTTSECTHVIADTIEFTGNSHLANTDCTGVGTEQIGGAQGVALFE